jgi:hypothetical protein
MQIFQNRWGAVNHEFHFFNSQYSGTLIISLFLDRGYPDILSVIFSPYVVYRLIVLSFMHFMLTCYEHFILACTSCCHDVLHVAMMYFMLPCHFLLTSTTLSYVCLIFLCRRTKKAPDKFSPDSI